MKVHKTYDGYKVLMSPVLGIWQVLLYKGAPNEDDECEAVVRSYDHEPTMTEIKRDVLDLYNEMIQEKILSGHVFEGHQVWLSLENQINYKATYDLAVRLQGEQGSLPVTIKMGSDDAPYYRKFETVDDLEQFCLGVFTHIKTCLEQGRMQKENINWSLYEDQG